MELFSSMIEARVIIEDWRKEYNEIRPHSSLGYLTPDEFSKNSELSIATLNQVQSSVKVYNNTNF